MKYKNIKFTCVVFADSETTKIEFTESQIEEIFLQSDKYLELCEKTGFDEISKDMFIQIDDRFYLVFSYVWYVTEMNGMTGIKQYYFRKREEFTKRIKEIAESQNVLIYYHNLSYDMRYLNYQQQFTKEFTIKKIMAYSQATPLCYEMEYNNNTISLRDSAKLFALKIKQMGDILNFKKLDYNYDEIRYVTTKLDEDEIRYGIRDTEIMKKYFCMIYNIENFMNISSKKLSFTYTGNTRKYVKSLSNSDKRMQYKDLKEICTVINDDLKENPEKFNFCKLAYFGGLCFSNHARTGKIIKNVHSMDLTSSYPSAMIYGEYASGIMEEEKNSEEYLNKLQKIPFDFVVKRSYRVLNRNGKGFIARLRLKNVRLKKQRETKNIFPCILTRKILDKHTLEKLSETTDLKNMCEILPKMENVKAVNNKLVSADVIELFTTNIDFFIINQCYKIDEVECIKMYTFPVKKIKFWNSLIDNLALNKQFHKIMLDDIDNNKFDLSNNNEIDNYNNAYGFDSEENKKLLKNTEIKQRYDLLKKLVYTQRDKGRLNGLYGINVQNPINNNYIINEYGHLKKTSECEFNSNEFTSFLLGLFITAYSRLQLYCGYVAIKKLKGCHIYSDTDSHKFTGDKTKISALANKICVDVMNAKNHELNKKYGFGGYDLEHSYKNFYTLGSKFYIVELFEKDKNDNLINGTISGISNVDMLLNYNKDDYKTTINLFCKPFTEISEELTTFTSQLQHFQGITGTLLINASHTICKQDKVYKALKIFDNTEYSGQKLIFKNDKIVSIKKQE